MHFEDILSKEALRIFDKACEGFRVESLPAEICQDMFQKLFLLGQGITYTEAASAAVHVFVFAPQLLNITCIFIYFLLLDEWFTTDLACLNGKYF